MVTNNCLVRLLMQTVERGAPLTCLSQYCLLVFVHLKRKEKFFVYKKNLVFLQSNLVNRLRNCKDFLKFLLIKNFLEENGLGKTELY